MAGKQCIWQIVGPMQKACRYVQLSWTQTPQKIAFFLGGMEATDHGPHNYWPVTLPLKTLGERDTWLIRYICSRIIQGRIYTPDQQNGLGLLYQSS